MARRPQGIPLSRNVVIKPHFILNEFSSSDEEENEDIVHEEGGEIARECDDNFEGGDVARDNFEGEEVASEFGDNYEKGDEKYDKYDGNFFKNKHCGNYVPMEVFENQKPGDSLNVKNNKKEEEVEKTEEERENEKNRNTFLDWKRKLESEDGNKCTKEEYAVAKHLRFNVPVRDSKFVAMGEEVKAFFAKDAVDALLESKWAKNNSGEIQITDRKSCVNLMNIFLQKGLFHRAVKVERKKDKSDKTKKKKKEEDVVEEDKKAKKEKKTKTEGQESEAKGEDKKKDKKDEEKKEEKKDEKKKKERKLKLNMHDDQQFIDGDNIYVWIYDPIPAKTFIIGLLMVVGAVGFCLFPLWPDEMRIGVYYLSLVGASFVGFVLFLVVLKQILFCLFWLLTFGKIHFWLFPNLTEDVGVIESFKPFYEVKRPGETKQKAKDVKKEMRKRREKALENEETESETQEGDGEKTEEQGFEMVSHEDIKENGDKVQDQEDDEDKDHEGDDEDLGEEDEENTESGNNSDNVENKKDK